jgi:hypothetical protein
MRTTVHEYAWIAATVLAVSVGCKVGNPLDRTVRVTQQPATDELDSPSPRTRLASSAIKRGFEMPVNNDDTVDTVDSDVSPNKGVAQASAKSPAPATAVARKTPTTTTKSAQPPSKTTVASSKPATGDAKKTITNSSGEVVELPDEYVELLDAFRDSPPEVQQQALRQLLAVSGQSLKRTQSPEGIASALRSTVDDLPALPEDFPDAESLPIRLAAEPAPTEQTSVQTIATAVAQSPVATEQEPEHDSDTDEAPVQVAQAGGASSNKMAHDWAVKPASATSEAKPLAPPAPAEPASIPAVVTTPSLASSSDEELYQELVKRMEQASPGESDADRYRRNIIARHLMMFSGNPDAAVAPIDGMSEKEQEFLRHYLLGMWSMVDTAGHPVAARRWSAALPEIRQATQQLASAAEALDIRSLAFCREIQSYGQTTKFDSNRFEPGQKVILYCEIDNFVAEKTQAGFETHLQGSYEVFDSKGTKVAGQVLPADQQVCANYLRDYFIAYQMSLPIGLEPGTYRMQLTMECMKGQKYGQASIPLEIGKSPAK